MRINSIRFKLIAIIIVILLIIISIALFYTITSQRKNVIDASLKTISTNKEILNNVIRNIMLNGEAPIAVNTMRSLKEIEEFKEINIYRVDGANAFNDYDTIEKVNKYQKIFTFEKTQRVNKSILDNPLFTKVLKQNSPESRELKNTKEVEYFFPILNYNECKVCHGYSGFIRGIAHFKVSLEARYKQINYVGFGLTIFFIILGIIFAVILIFIFQKLLVNPLLKIGNTVKRVGEGNLDIKVHLKQKDELGDLAGKINDMIIGLKERFHLTKYVSKSTENIVKKGLSQDFTGERKQVVVLFSDIRGFTAYSDTKNPNEVVLILNKILLTQAEIIEKYKGDIDKFVGDELMAIFEDEYTAVKCAVELIKNVITLNKSLNTQLFIGIGINSGEVVAGNIGSKNRTEYAVIGDTVNFASRLCGLAKANMILISESMFRILEKKIEAKLIPEVSIKGKAKKVNIYLIKKII